MLAQCLPSRLFGARPCLIGLLLLRSWHIKVLLGKDWLLTWLLLHDWVAIGEGRYAPGLPSHACVTCCVCRPTMGLYLVCFPDVLGLPQRGRLNVYGWIGIDDWVLSMTSTCRQSKLANQVGVYTTCKAQTRSYICRSQGIKSRCDTAAFLMLMSRSALPSWARCVLN